MTPLGGPRSRISRVSRRVSTPEIPISPCDSSQASSGVVARQLAGPVTLLWTTSPRAAGVVVSISSGFVPDITDMRKGEGNDLRRIRGIGQDLLVAGHRGVKADLADRRAAGP